MPRFMMPIVVLVALLGSLFVGSVAQASKIIPSKGKTPSGYSCERVRLHGKVVKKCTPIAKSGQPGTNGSNGAPGAAGAKGDKGDTGPAGANGTNGVNGANGANGVSGYEVMTYDYQIGPGYGGAGGGAIATAACSSQSKSAVGGGYVLGDIETNANDNDAVTKGWTVIASQPGRMNWSTNTPFANRTDGWIVRLNAPAGAGGISMRVYVICVNAL